MRWRCHLAGVGVFLLVATPWYAVVVHRHPGLLAHLLDAEVVDRVATDRFGRNGEWYGWLKVYAPTIILGAMPWAPGLFRWFGTLVRDAGRWRDAETRRASAEELFVCLWALLPLVVFCLARSRLPLYVLPIFAPLAIAIARTRMTRGLGMPGWPTLAVWAGVLLAIRFAASIYPTDADASRWSHALRERVQGPIGQVVFVDDDARYGLHFYLGAEVRRVSRTAPADVDTFNPRYDASLWTELQRREHGAGRIFVAREPTWGDLERDMRLHGYRARVLGQPFAGRVVFDIAPVAAGDARRDMSPAPAVARDPLAPAAATTARP